MKTKYQLDWSLQFLNKTAEEKLNVTEEFWRGHVGDGLLTSMRRLSHPVILPEKFEHPTIHLFMDFFAWMLRHKPMEIFQDLYWTQSSCNFYLKIIGIRSWNGEDAKLKWRKSSLSLEKKKTYPKNNFAEGTIQK